MIDNRHEKILTDLAEEIRRNPDAEFTSKIKTLATDFREMETASAKNVVKSLLLNLYGLGSAKLDAKQLRRDIAKVSVFGGGKSPTSSERVALLRCLYDALSFFVQGDFTEIIETCDQIEAAFADQG